MTDSKAVHWKKGAQQALERAIQSERFGLVSDVDGTLSPIVDDPKVAAISPRNLALLNNLEAKLDMLALISGRRVRDLVEKVEIPNLILIGNHGMEKWEGGRAVAHPEARPYRAQLEKVLVSLEEIQNEGVIIEDKDVSVAVHYRQSISAEAFEEAHAQALEELAEMHSLTFARGRMVFEFKPPIKVNKGSALRSLAEEHQLTGLIYLGDDRTDISAFESAKEMRNEGKCAAWGIAVRSAEHVEGLLEAADYFAEGVDEVEDFLEWLLKARRASST